MADVFISYHEDSAGELAQTIAASLENAGISCWFARRDMPFGSDFAREIPNQINSCRVFLLILNENVYRSAHIENEVGLAFSRRNEEEDIYILPIEVGDFVRKDWVRYYLIHVQSVKFPVHPDEQRIQSLVKRIAKLLNYTLSPKSNYPSPLNFPSQSNFPSQKIIQSGKCGDNVSYKLDEDGVLTITGSGSMYDYAYEKKISAIATPWYPVRQTVRSVEIQDGITSIGDGAFSDCLGLTSVTIPESVTSINDMAFYRCVALTNVIIPDSVTFIGALAFDSCGLTSVSVPAYTHISFSAFPATIAVTRRQ